LSDLGVNPARRAPGGGGGSLTRIPPGRGYGLLLCCVVARSVAEPSCMLCCGVVGLWCVCVFVLLAAWVSKSFINLLRLPTSTKTEQKLYQNRPQMGPIWARGGEGGTENQRKYEKI
jgi:hypothetical protein